MNEEMLKSIAEKYGTPAYVFEESKLIERIKLIRNRIPEGTGLCFAMKANPFLTGVMDRFSDRLEVCSPGEYEICIRNRISPDKIIVSGVNKTRQSMERIFEYSKGAGIYTIESELHYEILRECAKKHNVRISVILRLSSGNQFGMDSGTLERVLERIISDNDMDAIGIHYYSGTQKKLKKVEKDLAMLNEYADRLKKRFSISKLELEYGPGLMVTYFSNEQEADAKVQLDGLSKLLEAAGGYDGITIELGRFLVSCCGGYLTRIMDIKHTEQTNFLIVDGGIHQLGYYGQLMGMKKPYIKVIGGNGTVSGEFNICGSLCTINDVLVRDIELSNISRGDIIVFERCGAYSVTEGAALFLSRELPAIILVHEDGSTDVLRHIEETNYLNSQREDI